MRYYDLIETPLSGKTFLEDGENRLPKTDERVAIYFQAVDKVRYDRAFDDEGYPILLEYELQGDLELGEELTRYSKYLPDMVDGIYVPDLVGIANDLSLKDLDEWKASRVEAVDNIVVTTTSGKQFDGDEVSQDRMDRACRRMERSGTTTTEWSLADTPTGVMTLVTLDEMDEACKLAGEEQTRLWSI